LQACSRFVSSGIAKGAHRGGRECRCSFRRQGVQWSASGVVV
jgi:hypothetical protein